MAGKGDCFLDEEEWVEHREDEFMKRINYIYKFPIDAEERRLVSEGRDSLRLLKWLS